MRINRLVFAVMAVATLFALTMLPARAAPESQHDLARDTGLAVVVRDMDRHAPTTAQIIALAKRVAEAGAKESAAASVSVHEALPIPVAALTANRRGYASPTGRVATNELTPPGGTAATHNYRRKRARAPDLRRLTRN